MRLQCTCNIAGASLPVGLVLCLESSWRRQMPCRSSLILLPPPFHFPNFWITSPCGPLVPNVVPFWWKSWLAAALRCSQWMSRCLPFTKARIQFRPLRNRLVQHALSKPLAIEKLTTANCDVQKPVPITNGNQLQRNRLQQWSAGNLLFIRLIQCCQRWQICWSTYWPWSMNLIVVLCRLSHGCYN